MKKKRLSLESNFEDEQQHLGSAFDQVTLSKASKGAKRKGKDFFSGVVNLNESSDPHFGEDSQKRMQELLD